MRVAAPILPEAVVRMACVRQVEICGDMTIELTTSAAAHALADYLERCGCTVAFVTDCTVDVMLPARCRSRRDELLELHAYLRVWRAMHPAHDIASVEGA